MIILKDKIGLMLLSLIIISLIAEPLSAKQTIIKTTFTDDLEGWEYVAGAEFPGAKGDMSLQKQGDHNPGCIQLNADFTAGGAYVGLFNKCENTKRMDATKIVLRVKTRDVKNIGVRLIDSSGQCHQANNIPVPATGTWQNVTLQVDKLVGGEHWDGANDGKWHGPIAGLGINVGKNSFGTANPKGTILIDEIRYDLTYDPTGTPTIKTCKLSQSSCRPGYGVYVTYRFDAVPMGREYNVFVHYVRDTDGKMACQDDHAPDGTTVNWDGPMEYEHTIGIPVTTEPGTYRIMAGLWDTKSVPGQPRPTLKTGPGVKKDNPDSTSYQIGTLIVDPNAPLPPVLKPTLDLTGYEVTFTEAFDDKLDVSPWGPGTKWIAHTPYGGDFGDAAFTDPTDDFPFVVSNGVLRIEAKTLDGRWRSGLISSVDKKGDGFSQKYGYFEMRAKLPKGEGTWPAFWLLGVQRLTDPTVDQIELDVVEQYGTIENLLCTNIHWWYADHTHDSDGKAFVVRGMTEGMHTYGVMVEEDFITFYYDRAELRKCPTPEEAKVPLYILANLAMGSGWNMENSPNPCHMYIDYIRAYQKK